MQLFKNLKYMQVPLCQRLAALYRDIAPADPVVVAALPPTIKTNQVNHYNIVLLLNIFMISNFIILF